MSVDSTSPEAIQAELHAAFEQLPAQPDLPEETAESTARALWHAAAGHPLSAFAACEATLPALDEDGLQRLRELARQRLAGTPLAHLTGRQRFLDMEMLATADALVPRRETELLAREAIAIATSLPAGARVIDACTGCGNVALALARHGPRHLRVFGADLSDEAVALARENARHLGLADRVAFECGDLLAPFDTAEFLGQVALLTCNPPYISSSRVDDLGHAATGREPRLAFDGGPLGVAILLRLLQDAPRLLADGGWLAFEIGLGQGPVLARRLQASPDWDTVRSATDAHGDVRVLLARRAPRTSTSSETDA
ncbi:MAG: HemK family protein methyltransferase [Pseudoxanthomonas sp.]